MQNQRIRSAGRRQGAKVSPSLVFGTRSDDVIHESSDGACMSMLLAVHAFRLSVLPARGLHESQRLRLRYGGPQAPRRHLVLASLGQRTSARSGRTPPSRGSCTSTGMPGCERCSCRTDVRVQRDVPPLMRPMPVRAWARTFRSTKGQLLRLTGARRPEIKGQGRWVIA